MYLLILKQKEMFNELSSPGYQLLKAVGITGRQFDWVWAYKSCVRWGSLPTCSMSTAPMKLAWLNYEILFGLKAELLFFS